MPTKGVSMRKIKSILRLHYDLKLSQHQIANSLNLSIGAVNKYINKAKKAGMTWPLPDGINEDELEQRLKNAQTNPEHSETRHSIDFSTIHSELQRKGMTVQLLWEEYAQITTAPLSYVHFCRLYRQWRNTQPKSMRQTHKAGDKVFVDYAGQTMDIIDPDTGEVRSVQIFVGILGASNYTYAEATWSQQLHDWIASHRRMFDYFGGVPALVVPDNLKSGISKACRYEPDTNPTYADFIDHYGTAVLPARPVKPKDKSKVENAVLVVERWILARLRRRTFLGLTELNAAIHELLHQLNHRPFKKLPGCRASLFAETDKPALRPLPVYPYEFLHFKRARVHVDYHIELDHHYYSVPYQFIGKEIAIRYTSERVECWYKDKQIALHARSHKKGKHTTIAEHMPKSHRRHMEWTPGRFLNWAAGIGAATTQYVKYLLESRRHPEQGYRSCLGLLNLAKRFGEARLEKACERAWKLGAKTRKSVESILIHNMDRQPLPEVKQKISAINITHENIRGKKYYH